MAWDAVTTVFARARVFGEETCVRGQEKRSLPRRVVRDSFVSYGLSNVCVSSVCLPVVRDSGRMGPNRAAASALLEEREGERDVSFSDDTFFFSINF